MNQSKTEADIKKKFNLDVFLLFIIVFCVWFVFDTFAGQNDTRKTRDSGLVKEVVCGPAGCRARVAFENIGERIVTLHSVALIGDYVIEECTEQYRFLDKGCRLRFIGE